MINLGVLYENGRGVPQDYAKAREWYEKAADKGDADAMIDLGLLYENGQRRAAPLRQGARVVRKGRRQGQRHRDDPTSAAHDENGRGVPQDYARAREWYEKAADKGTAGAVEALESLDIKDRRYDEALRLAKTQEAKTEKLETERDGKPNGETAQALNQVAWCALFAREFDTALSALERAHALLPADLMIETNRAHALMFLGREEEARVLYLAHKGERLSQEDSRSWERATADDFAEFRKAGLAHPMMGEIEKQLGVAR